MGNVISFGFVKHVLFGTSQLVWLGQQKVEFSQQTPWKKVNLWKLILSYLILFQVIKKSCKEYGKFYLLERTTVSFPTDGIAIRTGESDGAIKVGRVS